jgi:prepilin-type N-terminal cleavage/methylation domain-containing protein
MQEVRKKLRRIHSQRGFSLIEVLIVVAIASILMAAAILGTKNTLAAYKADAAANVVTSQLRTARQLAISQRRWVQVWFDSAIAAPDYAPHVRYWVDNTGTGGPAQPIVSLPLTSRTQFTLFAGLPDTPMGFGNASAVYIGGVGGGPPTMYFGPTGTFTSAKSTSALINGTIFVGIPGQTLTARAVTILGGTGRVRTYTWNGTSIGWRE